MPLGTVSGCKQTPHPSGNGSIRCGVQFMTLRHLPRKVCIFENNGNSKKSNFSFYQVSQKTFSARNQIHPTPGTSSNPTSVTYQSSKTKQLLLSSKHAYEDTPRSAHPPLPSSKARDIIPQHKAYRPYLYRKETCRREPSKCLTTRRRISVATV